MANKKFKFIDLSDEVISNINVPSISELSDKKTFIDSKNIEEETYISLLESNSEESYKQEEIENLDYTLKTNVEKKFFNDFKKEDLKRNNNVNKLIDVKEKLDVKTNIYLKSDLSKKIKRMAEETGNSRSSIINKLIEFAIKEFE